MNEMLKLKGVTKTYAKKVAVDNLDLSIPAGAIYGIIGPNGAGKTTTIRMIMNIIGPDSGEITYKGKPVDEEFKRLVGYLPEERGLYKQMTLKEIILYLGQLKLATKNDIMSRMDKWLDRMGLLEYKNSKVQELSKGMQQKLQFITTLIHDPEIIILDELFSGLDPINIEVIKNVILDLKKEGRTILFSTHVMEQAEKLVDNICMINGGKKVLDGHLATVKSTYGKNNIHLEIDGDADFLNDLEGVTKVSKFTNYIELTLSDISRSSELLKSITDKVRVTRFEVVEPSLYKIFINLATPGSEENTQLSGTKEGRAN